MADFDNEGNETDSSDGVLATISRAEIDSQIATAKRYPRSIDVVIKQALAMATVDKDTARSMYYVVPRSGRQIEGPSVRLAEVMASCWGNIYEAARVVSDDGKFIVAQGGCYDLEKNVKCTIEVRRRITDKDGRTYSDDMRQTTGNAAVSVALRNAIFRVVPRAVFTNILAQAKQVSLGQGKTMKEKAEEAFRALEQLGAKRPDILRVMRRAGEVDLTIDDLIAMHGMATAIRERSVRWEDYLHNAEDGERVEVAKQANDSIKKPQAAKAAASSQPIQEAEIVSDKTAPISAEEESLISQAATAHKIRHSELIKRINGKGIEIDDLDQLTQGQIATVMAVIEGA